jgi:hypothetical protein
MKEVIRNGIVNGEL